MSTVASFEIRYSRYLGPDGSLAADPPSVVQDPARLVSLYQAMVLTRVFDAKAVALQRTGRLGTYGSSLGQEAVAVGLAAPMQSDDVLVPSFREHGAQLLRGVSPRELFLFWGGDERGSDYAVPREDFPVSIPVGSHAPHAAGVALAIKLRRQPRAVVCVFGDGATSKGDVAEALNLAGTWKLPAVFVVNNNQWAISVPRRAQSAAKTLAQKAIAAGIGSEQVDGNDVIAVYHAVDEALRLARAGEGPSLIEALTYRLSDHTTADDARRYRDDAEVSAGWREEPITRLRTYLSDLGVWNKGQEEALLADCREKVETAAEAYLSTPPQPPEAIFDHLFATLPQPLSAQRDDLLAMARDDG